MLIQLKHTVSVGGALFGSSPAIRLPRVGVEYNALAIQEVQLSVLEIVPSGKQFSVALCSPRNWKGQALLNAPNCVIGWTIQREHHEIRQDFVDIERWKVLQDSQMIVDWASNDANFRTEVLIEIYMQEYKMADAEAVLALKHQGWSY